jgi:hypothetical protein
MPRGRKTVVVGEHSDRYACGECGYTVSNKTGFRLHGIVAHGKDTRNPVFNDMFPCNMCGEKFDNMFQLKTHIRHENHAGHATTANQ